MNEWMNDCTNERGMKKRINNSENQLINEMNDDDEWMMNELWMNKRINVECMN